jgi:hypothetical protein
MLAHNLLRVPSYSELAKIIAWVAVPNRFAERGERSRHQYRTEVSR